MGCKARVGRTGTQGAGLFSKTFLHLGQFPAHHLPQINVMFEILYPFGVALTKISICLNYLRIFPLQTFNECFCKVAMIFTACWCISTIIPQIDQYVECPPVSNTRERIRVNSDCINQKAFLISTAALNSFSDLCIFLWPARYIWGMHVPKEQRLGLTGLFCVGVM